MNRLVLIGICLLGLGAALAFAKKDDPVRKVEVVLNPGCDIDECKKPRNDSSYYNLLYVKATGDNDTIHALYSSIDTFTILLVRTDLKTQLNVNWTKLISRDFINESISLSGGEPIEISGFAFPTIYEFDDVNGKADMTQIPNNDSYWVKYETADMLWNSFAFDSSKKIIGTFETFSHETNGSVKFNVRYPGATKRDTTLPHMLLNADSSSLDFVLDSLDPKFKDSKFGLEVVFLTNYATNKMGFKKTLDDEYTPGTFKLWNVELADASATHSFLQWKPIFYYADPESLENSTITRQYDVKLNSAPLPLGIGSAVYDSSKMYNAMNISFGLEGNEKDGYFYASTNYSSWTFTVGMGAPNDEKMSPVVTLVIFIGFGLPAAVILIGLVVMIVKKIRGGRNDSNFESL